MVLDSMHVKDFSYQVIVVWQNVIIFGVEMILSVHVDDNKKEYLNAS